MTTAIDIMSEKNPTLAFELALELKVTGLCKRQIIRLDTNRSVFYMETHAPAIVDLESWVKKGDGRQLYIIDANWTSFLAFDQAANILQDERIKCFGESGITTLMKWHGQRCSKSVNSLALKATALK